MVPWKQQCWFLVVLQIGGLQDASLDPGCNVSDNHVCTEVFPRQSDGEAALGAFVVIISDRIQVSIADNRDVTLVFRHNIDAKFLDALC